MEERLLVSNLLTQVRQTWLRNYMSSLLLSFNMSCWFVTCWTIIYARMEGWLPSSCPLVWKPADSVISIVCSTRETFSLKDANDVNVCWFQTC